MLFVRLFWRGRLTSVPITSAPLCHPMFPHYSMAYPRYLQDVALPGSPFGHRVVRTWSWLRVTFRHAFILGFAVSFMMKPLNPPTATKKNSRPDSTHSTINWLDRTINWNAEIHGGSTSLRELWLVKGWRRLFLLYCSGGCYEDGEGFDRWHVRVDLGADVPRAGCGALS